MGRKTQQKFLYIDFNQVQCKIQRIRLDFFLSSKWIVSSLSNATDWVFYLSKWGGNISYLYYSFERDNNPTGPTSPCSQGRHSLGDSKIHFDNTFVGTTDLTYNKGFNSRLYMIKYINDIPNQRNNISRRGNNNNNRISYAVTFL